MYSFFWVFRTCSFTFQESCIRFNISLVAFRSIFTGIGTMPNHVSKSAEGYSFSIRFQVVSIQELCLAIIPTIGKLVDRQSMKTQLLPKLLKLATDGSVVAVSPTAFLVSMKHHLTGRKTNTQWL